MRRRLLKLNWHLVRRFFLLCVLLLHLDSFALLGLHDKDLVHFLTLARHRVLLGIPWLVLRITSSIVKVMWLRDVVAYPAKIIHHFAGVPLVLIERLHQLCTVEQIVQTFVL